jgi:hypothetical protein
LSRKNQTVRFQKPDYPVFVGLNPLDRTYTFTIFYFSLSLKNNLRVTPRPPLAIPWFLCGILEFLGEINSPRTGVSVAPTGFFLISRYFHLILNLFAPWMDLKFLWCIVFIHLIDQPPAISLSFLG